MVDDILNKKYNFTIHSDDFSYSNNLTKEVVNAIDKKTNDKKNYNRRIELSTYLKEKESSKKNNSTNNNNFLKKKSSIELKNERKSKRVRVEGGMRRGGPPAGPPAGAPAGGPDHQVNVILPAQTPIEDTTFDQHNNAQTNLGILENAYAITYNHRRALPPDARPIGTQDNFRADSIVSASGRNGFNVNTQAANANDSITAVACAQWFDTIWRSVVRNEHATHFAAFHRGAGSTYTHRRNLDGRGILAGRDSIGNRVRNLVAAGARAPPIAARNNPNVNIVYSSHEFRDSNGNVYNQHRTYKILFIISRDIHFTFFCHRYDGGNIEFCSPHYTFEPLNPADLSQSLARYHLYASAHGFLDGFNRNAVRNPIIALSILAHYISKTAYLLLFTDYARGNYGINEDYETISRAQVQYRPDRYDFVELGHYAAGLNIVIRDHFVGHAGQFPGQNLSWFYVHHEEIDFYLSEYHHWLPQILVTGNLALQRGADGSPPYHWPFAHPHPAARHRAIVTRQPRLRSNYRSIWNDHQLGTFYPNYTPEAAARYGDPTITMATATTEGLPRAPRQRPHPRWSDSFTGFEVGVPIGGPPALGGPRVVAEAGRERREDSRGPAKRVHRRGGAQLGISTNKTLIKYLNKEKELKIDIKLLKKDKNKKEIIKKTDLLKKLKLKIIDKKEKLKKQKEKEKEKEKLKKQKRKRKT